MWKLALALCSLPQLLLAQGRILFDPSRDLQQLQLSGSLSYYHDAPSPQRGEGRSLRIFNSHPTRNGELRLPLLHGGALPGGPRLNFEALSRDGQLTVIWMAAKAGQGLQICLENSSWSGVLCASLRAEQAGWQVSAVPYGRLKAEADLRPLEAGALVLRPLAAQGEGSFELWVDSVSLGATDQGPEAAKVARAFGVSEPAVHAVRRLGLPESLGWLLLIVDERCRCGAEALAAQRATKSWGEISQEHGWAWTDLVAEMHRRRDAAGLKEPEDSPDQLDRAARNDAFAGVQP